MKNTKVYFIAIIIGIIVIFNVKAENSPIAIQRLSTDYNGIVTNGNVILVYGNNGVITYSSDNGENWNQLYLGELNQIRKIFYIDGKFYALAPNSIFVGTSDCKIWIQKRFSNEEQFFDFTFVENFFYITAKNKIYKIERELATQPEIFFEFDEFTTLSEIVSLSNFLFIIESEYYIFKIDRETKQIDTIDVHPQQGSFTNRNLANLKIINSNLYVLMKYSIQSKPEFAFENVKHKLIASKDLGKNWEFITDNIRVSKEYLVDNGKIYFLSPKIIDFTANEKGWNVGYYYIDSNNELMEVNSADTIDKWIPFIKGSGNLNTFDVVRLNKINDNLLLAVGSNKTILKSLNGGLNWELVSYFKPLSSIIVSTKISFLGADSILIFSEREPFLFLSSDRGATFKPLFSKNIPNVPIYPNFIQTDNNSFIIFSNYVTYTEKSYMSDTIFFIFFTNDMRTSFVRKEFKMPLDTSFKNVIPLIGTAFFSSTKDTLVIVVSFLAQTPPDPPRLHILFDRTMNYIGSFYLNSNYEDYLYEDSAMYTIKGRAVYRSSDLGRNFELIGNLLSSSYYNNKADYLFNGFIRNSGKIRNKLILYKNQPQKKWILFLDKSTLQVDSFEVSQYGLVFSIADSIFFLNPNEILYFKNNDNKISLEGRFDTKSFVSEDLIFQSYEESNNQSYLFFYKPNVGTSLIGDKISELNIARIALPPGDFLPVDYEPERDDIYIYSSQPFPNPSNSMITINLYWDKLGVSDNITFSLYDIFGKSIDIERYDIIQTSNDSAIVKFDFSLIQNGIYYLSIRVDTKAILFPITIVK